MSLLDDLNPEQRAAVTQIEGPLLVVAGPGSGKTRVITARVAYMIDQGISPRDVLAMTFTNKAAAEMRDRVARYQPVDALKICTFHSFGAWLMRREAEVLGFRPDFSIYDTDDRASLIKRSMKRRKIDKSVVTPSAVAHMISDSKNRGITPDEFADGAWDHATEAAAEVFHDYDKALRDAHAMDFDDLLIRPLELFDNHKEVLTKYQGYFRYLMIDEYQDTNAIQYRIARHLAREHQNLCVTGDPDQSIYSWRGADIQNILNFERDFKGARVVILGRNYRSTANIVGAADALVRHNIERKDKTLSTDNEAGTKIRILKCSSETHEARCIAGSIEKLQSEHGLRPSDVAIFYRTNAQSRAIEQALRERRMAYQLVGAVSFFQRQEIKDVVAWLKWLVNPFDEVSFARAMLRPARGVGDGTVSKIITAARESNVSIVEVCRDPKAHKVARVQAKAVKALGEAAGLLDDILASDLFPVANVIDRIATESGYLEMLMGDHDPRSQDRYDNVQELISDARNREQEDPNMDLRSWLEQVALVSETDNLDETEEGTKLMTLHAAKGLEFPAVFLTGLEEGLLPHQRSIDGDGSIEEERRLCYVGITRAKRFLSITTARHREQFGQSQRNAPSRFLAEIPEAFTEIEDQSRLFDGTQDFADWFSGRTKNVMRTDDDDDPFDFSDEEDVSVEDGPADHLGDADAGSLASMPPVDNPTDAAILRAGDRVRHGVFGIGKVLEVNTSGRVKVNFMGWGEKSLAQEYARLEKL